MFGEVFVNLTQVKGNEGVVLTIMDTFWAGFVFAKVSHVSYLPVNRPPHVLKTTCNAAILKARCRIRRGHFKKVWKVI